MYFLALPPEATNEINGAVAPKIDLGCHPGTIALGTFTLGSHPSLLLLHEKRQPSSPGQ